VRHSESIAALAKALVAAQKEMRNPAKGSVGQVGNQKTRYADLAAVRDAVVPVLAKYGLSLTQSVGSTPDGPSVGALLLHESGEWLEYDPLTLPVSRRDAQGYGSAITYARRYQLQAIAGVTGDDDDDGTAAGQGGVNGGASDAARAAQPAAKPVVRVLARIKAREKALVAGGLCAEGELLAHVLESGAKTGLGARLEDWRFPQPGYGVVKTLIERFEEEAARRAARAAQDMAKAREG
jgi:ERF superfamily